MEKCAIGLSVKTHRFGGFLDFRSDVIVDFDPIGWFSRDFESKNGIRGSELTLFSSGWGLRDEGLDLPDALKGGPYIGSFIVDFDRIGVCFRRF